MKKNWKLLLSVRHISTVLFYFFMFVVFTQGKFMWIVDMIIQKTIREMPLAKMLYEESKYYF